MDFSECDLARKVVNAYGGIDRWNQVNSVTCDASIGGALWARKGWPNAHGKVCVTAEARRQCSVFSPFTVTGKRSVWQPAHVLIETDGGQKLEERDDPRQALIGETVDTPWDDLDLAYFSGYAMWNYLTTPFIFASPGFQFEEIEPWDGDGEERRRLKVKFPDTITTHCREQIFHIDSDGLMRRMDYNVDVNGNTPTAHYMSRHKNFDGLVFATERRAVHRRSSGAVIPEPVYVIIDIADVRVNA